MTGALLLACGAVALAVLAVATARRPADPLPDIDGYYDAWATLHGGYDPRQSRIVGGWLRLSVQAARPLARRGIQPWVVTLAGLLAATAVPVLAGFGGRWPAAAAVVAVLSGLLDNLDGAVAVLSGRTSRIGFVLDSVVDRVADGMYLVAFWAVGGAAAAPWCVAAGAAVMVFEYTRARAGNAGMGEVGVVAVGERPTRVIIAALFLLVAALFPAAAVGWAVAGAVATLVVSLVSLVQLSAAIRRLLG